MQTDKPTGYIRTPTAYSPDPFYRPFALKQHKSHEWIADLLHTAAIVVISLALAAFVLGTLASMN